MLRNKLAQAKDLIAMVNSAQIMVSQYNQYAVFLAELESNMSNLNRYQQACQALQDHLPEDFGGKDVTGIINKIDVMLNTLRGGSEPPKRFHIKQLADEVKVLEDELKIAWQKYVSQNTRNSLGVLSSIKGILDDPSKIDDVIKKFLRIQNQWPVAKKTMQDLTDSLKEARQIIQDLNAGEEVQEFLKLVSSRKARLSDLKPETLDWLQKQNLTKNLEITFANNQRRI